MKFEISPKSTETYLNWEDAVLYCQFLDIDSFGWRLPDKEELNEIFLMKNDFEKYWYWSSTEDNGNFIWCQFFGDGRRYEFTKNYRCYCYVRAIRSIKIDL